MYDIGIFTAEICGLYIFSRLLTTKLSIFLLFVTKSEKWTVTIISLLFFPGTLFHECAHMLMALICLVPFGKVSLFPQVEEKSLRLGSVMMAKTDPFRRFLIGTAPFMSMMVIAWGFTQSVFMIPVTNVVFSYLLFSMVNSMFSSKKDLEGTILLFILCFGLYAILFFLGFSLPMGQILHGIFPLVVQFAYEVRPFFFYPLLIDIVLVFLLSVSSRHT